MSKESFFTTLWIFLFISLLSFLFWPHGREEFISLTSRYPGLMGFFKFFILLIMGELLGRKLTTKSWQFRKIRLFERAIIWGILGIIFSFVFPLYSGGVNLLIEKNRLFIFTFSPLVKTISIAFWKSCFINLLFAFPFMTFHRITDTLIDQGLLLQKWPFLKIWNEINWGNMWKKVAPTIIWFWIPAHTLTFSLPSEFRILMAAVLGIALGVILSILNSASSAKIN